jgi:hypothetical protein
MPRTSTPVSICLLDQSEISFFAGLASRDRAKVLRMVLRDAMRTGRAYELIETACIPFNGDRESVAQSPRRPLKAVASGQLTNSVAKSQPASNSPPDADVAPLKTAPTIPPVEAIPSSSSTSVETARDEAPRPPAAGLLKNFFGQNPNTNAVI